jgi:oxygen-independent coproporphyrinogen-3 oxidase
VGRQYAARRLIPHLSCYALTVEPGTPLDSMTKKKKVQPVSNDAQALQFMMMTDFFQEKGYEHYEISNLSMPGKRSIHNSSYWSGSKYLGLGPSAHSFNGKSRQWNIANNALYIQSLKNGSIPFEIEMLTETQRYNEYIMTSLRKMEGVDIGHIKNFFGSKYSNELIQASKKFIDKKWIDKDKADNLPGTLILTREGKLFADHIASALFG